MIYTPCVWVTGGEGGERYEGLSLPLQDHVPVLCAKARRRMAEAKAYRNEGS